VTIVWTLPASNPVSCADLFISLIILDILYSSFHFAINSWLMLFLL
jgi:hypothetical protein